MSFISIKKANELTHCANNHKILNEQALHNKLEYDYVRCMERVIQKKIECDGSAVVCPSIDVHKLKRLIDTREPHLSSYVSTEKVLDDGTLDSEFIADLASSKRHLRVGPRRRFDIFRYRF